MRRNMIKIRNVLPIAVVVLLLSLALITPTVASDGNTNSVGVIIITDDGSEVIQVNLNEEEIAILKTEMCDFESWCRENEPLNDLQLDDQEKIEIRQYIVDIIDALPENIPSIDPDELLELMTPIEKPEKPTCDLGWMNRRNTIISVGSLGATLIPFYKYEAFIRLGIPFLRTIRVLYFKGYTAFLRLLPPDIRLGLKTRFHFVSARGFLGLYINIGDFIVDKVAGPVVILGRAYVSALGS